MRILVVNAGSSSVKLSLIADGDETLEARELAAPRARVDPRELRKALAGGLDQADAVGHRIVHGGERFLHATIVEGDVAQALAELSELAPLHQPKSLAALEAVSRALPRTPSVACFDTAFHATLPPAAHTYAVPQSWRERWGLRRFGFHGLSHAWVARRTAEILGRREISLVSAHLGAGASLCAIRAGISVDTTMGFTPLEGLVMATRSGSIDPGMLVWLLDRESGLQAGEIADALEHESGLMGLAGTPDMREVLARNDDAARLALEVYIHRLCGSVAAMSASLGGIDALAFTGGVGEHAPEIRARAAGRLSFLGVAIDDAANRMAAGDEDITAPGASIHTLVIRAREDLEIARQVRAVLQ